MAENLNSSSPSPTEDYREYKSVAKSFEKLVELMSKDEDNDLTVFRKFKKLTLYSLLAQQNKLIVLDNNVSKWASNQNENRDDEEMENLLQRAHAELKDYHEALGRASRILQMPPLSERLAGYLPNLSESYKELHPIVNSAGEWDLTAIAASKKGSIHKYINRYRRLEKIFCKPPNNNLPEGMLLYSEKQVRATETVLINVTFCVLVMLPIVALSYVKSKGFQFAIIAVTVILASILASGLSDSSHRSSLAVIAGYTGILVVFLSNNLEGEARG